METNQISLEYPIIPTTELFEILVKALGEGKIVDFDVDVQPDRDRPIATNTIITYLELTVPAFQSNDAIHEIVNALEMLKKQNFLAK